jgi:hypothetical protein
MKYQYLKYFEVNFGGSFSNVNDLPYFDDAANKGVFLLNKAKDINRTRAFVNLLFHKGPYGFFYGELNYNYVKFNDDTNVPYYPAETAELIYGFDISETVSAKTKLDIMLENYSGIENSTKLPAYVDWSIYLYYNLFGNLKLAFAAENLLNNDNYIYDGYREKTIDFIGGIEYRW